MDAIKVKLIGLSRGGGGNLQPDKTVTPTEQDQTVRPDPGYDGLRQVTVEAIPDQYADVSGVDAGAGDVRVGKVIVGSDGETITGTMPPQKPEEIGHATPTEQAQTVTPTAGSVFSAVEVEPIPSEYADVSSVDATAADVRTGKTIVDAQGNTITGEMEPQKPEQVKAATPTTAPQSVTPDTGYALSRVDVGAIPSEYADVSDVTATAGTVLTGSDFVDASGTLVHGACDYDADTSDADATAGQIEAGATAYVNGAKVMGTMPVRSADVEISDLSPVPIPAGSYDGTTVARLADPTEVDAQYIAQGHSILGVQGALVAQDNLPALVSDTLTSISDSTLTDLPNYALYYKTNLRSVSFQSVTTIRTCAFSNCSHLQSVDLPMWTECLFGGSYGEVFKDCDLTGDIVFPRFTVTGNGRGHFQNNTHMTSFSAPVLRDLVAYMFKDDSMLSSVNVPSVRVVRNAAFEGTAALLNLSFPSLVSATGVRNYESFKAPSLQRLDLGENTATLTSAFGNAPNLATIIIRATAIPTLSGTLFTNTPFASGGTGGTIYIPETLYNHLGDGTALDYKAATNWSVIDAYGTITWAKIEGSQYEVTS